MVNTRVAPTQLKVDALDEDIVILREKLDGIKSSIEKTKGLNDLVDNHQDSLAILLEDHKGKSEKQR